MMTSQLHRKLAPVLALLLLAIGLSLSVTASAQDNESADAQGSDEQAEGEQTEGEQTEGEQAEGAQDGQADGSSLRRSNRMEFDARLIRGESAGSGAVFLFERGQRPLPSMIDKRKSFLRDSVSSVLGNDWADQFEEAQNEDAD